MSQNPLKGPSYDDVDKPCSYSKKADLVGGCRGPLTGRVRAYFASGADLILCDGHVDRWNKLHPAGPKAERVKGGA